jgi:hypothetical protein
MITIKAFDNIKAVIEDGMKLAYKDAKIFYKDGQRIMYLSRKPTLTEQYLIDMTYLEKHPEIDRYFRPCHPNEVEGYEDINELKEYVTVVSRTNPWYVCKIPPCIEGMISPSIGQGQWTLK